MDFTMDGRGLVHAGFGLFPCQETRRPDVENMRSHREKSKKLKRGGGQAQDSSLLGLRLGRLKTSGPCCFGSILTASLQSQNSTYKVHTSCQRALQTRAGQIMLPMPGAPSSSLALFRQRLFNMFEGADKRVIASFWLFGELHLLTTPCLYLL